MTRAEKEAAKWLGDKWPGKADAAQDGYVAGFKKAIGLAAHECDIVRDSPVRCVDPCTEDWIAQRIRKLDD